MLLSKCVRNIKYLLVINGSLMYMHNRVFLEHILPIWAKRELKHMLRNILPGHEIQPSQKKARVPGSKYAICNMLRNILKSNLAKRRPGCQVANMQYAIC